MRQAVCLYSTVTSPDKRSVTSKSTVGVGRVIPMRRWIAIIVALLLVGLAVPAASGSPQFPDFVPFDGSVVGYPVGNPEGVAVNEQGRVFTSVDFIGEVWRFNPRGRPTLMAEGLPAGALGMATDERGRVYVASNGVYRVGRGGSTTRLPGTEAIEIPNALAFDDGGTLWITETFSLDPATLTQYTGCSLPWPPFGDEFGDGGLWRVPPGGEAELVLRHELLTGVGAFCSVPGAPPFPIGANGIDVTEDAIYVANTEKALIVRVAFDDLDNPQVVAQLVEPPSSAGPPVLDGIALDEDGDVYALVINQSRLVKFDLDAGTVETVATAADGLDFPASLAFGKGQTAGSLFITNYAIGPPGGAGPGLVRLDIGFQSHD